MGTDIYLKRVEIKNKGEYSLAIDGNSGKPVILDPVYRPGPSTHEPDIEIIVRDRRTGKQVDVTWPEGQKEPVVTGTLPGPANS